MTGDSTHSARRTLLARLFPHGVPRLWCPTLTHFAAAREPDAARIGRHLQVLAPYVKGILVPGSTGEGWEMSDTDIRRLLDIVLDAARAAQIRVLIGVLKTDTDAMLASLDALEDVAGHPAVAGFTICPPKGAALSQNEIADALRRVLARGLPTALYQLPQVTQNEMSAETVSTLAAESSNFILFKDTSGADRVALSDAELGGVFLVRGAEGDYARWPKSAGGPYDGFLLSTANGFARELAQIQSLLDEGRTGEAQALSHRVGEVVHGAFGMVSGLATGNAFTNANKLLDHLMAHGPAALQHEPPMLFSGARLPMKLVEEAHGLLLCYQLMPAVGYLEGK